MARSAALLEDATAIRMALQRLCATGSRLEVAYKAQRASYMIFTEDGERLAFRMPFDDISLWGLKSGENLAIKLVDRGLEYDCVVAMTGQQVMDGVEACLTNVPRVLRRSDMHRLADFIPDPARMPSRPATFTNARNALIDGTVQSFGEEGLELVLRNKKQDIRELLRMGEESLLDVALDNNLRLQAPTTVAYFGDNLVGLRFTQQADAKVLSDYRNWVHDQQVIQAQQDREDYSPRGFQEATARINRASVLPSARIIVDRDPMILLLTEREDFARRLGESLSRKFGLASFDYIKGSVRSQLKEVGGDGEGWGRVRMILVHNQLRLSSPLEVCRQLVGQEGCPLPVILMGTEENELRKRNHAVVAGAVDYVVVEPFKILSILRRLDEILRQFDGIYGLL
jgi:CheY-like chemotaxis protein